MLFDGNRAVGVEYEQRRRKHASPLPDVRWCCAAAPINSPQLLMLSGIGDRDHLAEHGIDSVHHAPEVGQNLIDHLVRSLGFDVAGDSLAAAEKPTQLINYLLRRRGMLTSNVGEAYGFVRSRPDLQLPDVELIFAPAPFYDEGLATAYARPRRGVRADPGRTRKPRHRSRCGRLTRTPSRSSIRGTCPTPAAWTVRR